MEKAYSRLIMRGLPCDVMPVVVDFKDFWARPKHSESVSAWAEAVVPLGEVTNIFDSQGNVPTTDGNVDEDFLRFGVQAAMPHQSILGDHYFGGVRLHPSRHFLMSRSDS